MSLERAGPVSCRLLGKAWLHAGEGSAILKNNPLLFLRAFKPLGAATPAQTSSSVLSALLFQFSSSLSSWSSAHADSQKACAQMEKYL